MINRKSKDEIKRMRHAGHIVALVHQEMKKAVVPGISTKELDDIAMRVIKENKAVPTFLGYNGFPASICTSINEKIVHGIPSKDEILDVWKNFRGVPQELELPSAPKQFLNYFTEDNMPQTRLNRMLEGGMAISIGRLREDTQYDYKFVCLSHNTLRGAAGGAVLLAELLCAKGYMD